MKGGRDTIPVDASQQRAATLLSTTHLPERDRLAVWREVYGRQMLRLEVEPLRGVEFRSDLELQTLSDLCIVTGSNSPMRVGRSRQLLTDGDDGLTLQISSKAGIARQLGRDVAVGAGEAVVLSNADVGSFTFPSDAGVIALRLQRSRLRSLVRDFDAVLAHPVRRRTPALRLLVSYLRFLRKARSPADPALQRAATAHIYDLLAVALGGTRDAVEHAAQHGLRATALQAVKAGITANLHEADLSASDVAMRYGLTLRSLQRLFSDEGTTLSEFTRQQRLDRVRKLLSDPSRADRTITSLAFEAGFRDLSYFNRTFRLRFGCTPSDARAAKRV